ncbi:MAG TPA: LemA family protein [Armatimonadota bacterium]|jgi:LemA protein
MLDLLIVIIIIAPALWFIRIYNRFVTLHNLVKEAWSGIDVQLKRRYDLVPNLVEIVKGYTGHERNVFENVAALRTSAFRSDKARLRSEAENALSQTLKSLFAVAEAYPQLKADGQFLSLQATLTEVEDQIQFARRYYNGTVRNYNILVQSFPSNLVANNFHYEKEDYFEIELVTQRDAPEVAL